MSNALHDDAGASLPTEKRCPKCGEIKPVSAFSKDASKTDGLRSGCRSCARVRKVAHYAEHRDEERARNAANYGANREKRLAWQKAYYEEHREERRAYGVDYRAANAEKRAIYQAAYYAAHRDKLCAYQHVYRRAHPDKIRACNAAYYGANPEVWRAQAQRRRIKIKGNGGAGVSPAELSALRATQAGICSYCQLHYDDPLQIDHVIPIDQGGPHEIANIVLACRDCNNNKRARTPEQWTKRWYHARNSGGRWRLKL